MQNAKEETFSTPFTSIENYVIEKEYSNYFHFTL